MIVVAGVVVMLIAVVTFIVVVVFVMANGVLTPMLLMTVLVMSRLLVAVFLMVSLSMVLIRVVVGVFGRGPRCWLLRHNARHNCGGATNTNDQSDHSHNCHLLIHHTPFS